MVALSRCDHPNLVKILTSGSDGDRHYYAMELVEGTTLSGLAEVLTAWRRQGAPLRETALPAAASSSRDLAERRRHAAASADGDGGGRPPLAGGGADRAGAAAPGVRAAVGWRTGWRNCSPRRPTGWPTSTTGASSTATSSPRT